MSAGHGAALAPALLAAVLVPALLAAVLGGAAVAAVGSARRSGRARAAAGRVQAIAGGSRAGPARPALPAPPRWFCARVADADLPGDPARLWWALLAGAGTLPVGAFVAGGAGAAVLATVAVLAGPVVAAALLAGRADRRLDAALPERLETIARHLRAGAGLRQAIEGAADGSGPAALDLQRVAADVEHGRPLREALEDWARRRPRPGVRLAVTALLLGAATGGAQARAIDGVAATLRTRLAVGAEVQALATQARTSALVLVAAPVVFAVLAAVSDPRTASFLFATPLGLACLGAGALLDLAGGVWMARLCRLER